MFLFCFSFKSIRHTGTKPSKRPFGSVTSAVDERALLEFKITKAFHVQIITKTLQIAYERDKLRILFV